MEGLQQIDDLDRHFDSIKGPSDRAPRVSEAPSLPRSILEPIEEATDWGPKQFNISAGEATHTKTEESSSSEVDNQGNFTDRAKQTQSDTEDMPREANKQITNEANQTQADKVPAPEKSDSISTSISSLALVSHEFQAPEAPEAPIDPVGNKGDAPIPAPAASAGMIGGMEVCSASDGSHNEKQKLLPAVGVHDEQQPTAYRPVNAEETLTAGSSQQCHPNRDCQGYGKRSRDASPNSILRAHPFLGRITNWLVRQDDKSPPLTTTTCAFCDGNLMTNPLPYNVPEPQVHLPCGHKFDFLSVFEGLVKHHGEILRCPEPRCISIQHTCGHSATHS
jgi:hypothetical protein